MLIQSELVSILNEALSQQGKFRKAGSQLIFHCPFCADKNLITRKLEIALSGPRVGNYHCWRCDTKGSSFGHLLKRLNAPQNIRDAVFKLTGDIRIIRRSESDSESCVVLPDEFKPLSIPRNSPEYRNAIAYLKRRGVGREDILRYHLGYCEDGEYEHHIIIPSYDAEGALNFFIGRRYYDVDGIPRHKKPNVSMDLVGFECFVNYNEPVILVEGAFNAIAIRQNAIPLFGKFPSKTLYSKLISNNVPKVYVCLDADAEQESLSICTRLLRLGISPFIVNITGGKDANEVGFKKAWQCIESAIEVDSSFLLRKQLFA
jgi:DNA primase